MRRAAGVSAAVLCTWLVSAQEIPVRGGVAPRGAAEALAPESRTPRKKPCPPFLALGAPSSTPWCSPRSEIAGGHEIVSVGASPVHDLPRLAPEGADAVGGGAGPQDVLLGVTWNESELVSFDPGGGEVIRRHSLLNPDQAFTALAYDRLRHRLYALSQGTFVLTVIDTDTLQTIDIVNLQVDPRGPGLTDTVSLALDPATGTLYTIVGHWTNFPSGPILSDLATIDTVSGELTIIGRIDGPWIASLAFSETDRQLYAIGVFGVGASESDFPTHVLWIDPRTAASNSLFATPYHTMLGFADREPFTFFSWINEASRFYGRTDFSTQTVTPLGPADGVDVLYAMLYRSFSLPPLAVPIPAEPTSFGFHGRVSDVWDPGGRLQGRVGVGQRFTGKFSYDAAAPFKAPDPNSGVQYGFSLSINGLKYSSRGLKATIVNDRYDWNLQSLTDSFQLAVTSNPLANISWSLFDPTGAALRGSGHLPLSFDLSDWENNRFTVVGYEECCFRAVYSFSGSVDHVIRMERRALVTTTHPKPQIGRKPSGNPVQK